jgi:uncharacterized YccA/Bax inhibitor family protein
MANPALSDKILNKVSAFDDTDKMTIEGTVNKTGLLILLLVIGAYSGWSNSGMLLIIGFVGSLGAALFLIFGGAHRAPLLAPIYALCEGLLLGAISSSYAARYPGIVSNALILTIGALIGMLALYRFKIIRVTERFRSGLMIAMFAIVATYLANFAMSFFGSGIPMIHESTPMGIGLSLVIVGVAALNLLLDFDMIERAYNQGAPKYMEWYGGFALILTLVWLYLEILRLLGKMNRK